MEAVSDQGGGTGAEREPVDLGRIVAREVPPSADAEEPGAGSTEPPGAGPGHDAYAVPFERRSLRSMADQIGRGARAMAGDIVEARRGPVPNSRPVPEWVRGLAWLLDDSIPVGGGYRVGLDGIVSFIPGVGDAAGLVASMVVVLAGIAAGVSLPTTIRMMLHVGVDAIVGAVPFLGALFDLGFKANTRNIGLIEADLQDRAATRRSSIKVFLLSALVIAMAFFLLLFAMFGSIYLFYRLLASLF